MLTWNQFIIANSSPSAFQQSLQWGEFQKKFWKAVYRLEFGNLKAQVVVKNLPLGKSYLEISRGPIVANELRITNYELRGEFLGKLREIGNKENAVLARLSPPYGEEIGIGKQEIGFRKPEILLNQKEPDLTILVDLTKSPEELLAKMHEKARYNIRLAQKKGVTVRDATQDEKAFEKFLALLKETSARDKITLWPEARFRKFREFFMKSEAKSDEPRAVLLVGELNGQILAGAIVMLFGDTGTYLYAASSRENSPANAPSLVLWEAILATQKAGAKWYDMWGVAPSDDPAHSWSGITRFKTRYIKMDETGREFHYAGTFDYILDKKIYSLFKLTKRLKNAIILK